MKQYNKLDTINILRLHLTFGINDRTLSTSFSSNFNFDVKYRNDVPIDIICNVGHINTLNTSPKLMLLVVALFDFSSY